MIELVILDLYKTIWANNLPPRKGLIQFFPRYRNRRWAVATDDPEESIVKQILAGLGVEHYIERVYTESDLMLVKGQSSRGKNLIKICADYCLPKEAAVFISDGNHDRITASKLGVRFIHVPSYEVNNELFSFDLIDLDSITRNYTDLRKVNS